MCFFSQVEEVIVKAERLLECVRKDQRQLSSLVPTGEIGIFCVFENPQKSTNEINSDFIYSQLLIDVLCRLDDDPADKKKLINHLLSELSDKEEIRRFDENYSPESVIFWYTKQSGIYQKLNYAFTTQRIGLLFLFRYFIRDLCRWLREHQYIEAREIYRGQYMTTDELQHLTTSKNKLICVNSFFSTSKSEKEALKFIKNSPKPGTKKVEFIIKIDPKVGKTKPYADITKYSDYEYEQEILFVPGSIFRITGAGQDEKDVWKIYMEVCAENNHELEGFYNRMKKHLGPETGRIDLMSYGEFLYQMSQFKLSEEIFLRLSKELDSRDPKLIQVDYFLGMIAYEKEDYRKSIAYYERGLKILEETQPTNVTNIAQLTNCIGEAYRSLKDYDTALAWHNKLLAICDKKNKQHKSIFAHSYNNIALIYANQNKSGKALEFHMKSLAINEDILEEDHPDIARNHHNIGIALDTLGRDDEALDHYKTALAIEEKVHPSGHLAIAKSHQCIGCLYYKQNRWRQALDSFNKALVIYKKSLGNEHPKVERTKDYISRCEQKLKS